MIYLAVLIFGAVGVTLTVGGVWAIRWPDRYVRVLLHSAYLGRPPQFAKRRYASQRVRRLMAWVHGAAAIGFGLLSLFGAISLAFRGGNPM
ncbi:MAG: hypothetical protein ACRDT1_09125, partial [Micromonosporaceae bacterium]